MSDKISTETKSKLKRKTKVTDLSVQTNRDDQTEEHSSTTTTSLINVGEVSNTLSAFFQEQLTKHVTQLVYTFTANLAAKLECPQKQLIDIWNDSSPGYSMDTENLQPTNKETPAICQYYFSRAKKACDCQVSAKSETGKYCSKHLKEETKQPKSPTSATKEQCQHVTKAGPNPGKRCIGSVASKSETGKYCSKHYKTMEKEPGESKSKDSTSEEATLTFCPRKNKELGVYIDEKSGYIFNDDQYKRIFAKLVKGKIVALSAKDMKFLDSNNYEYDNSLLQKSEENIAAKSSQQEVESPTENNEEVSSGRSLDG